MEEKKFYEKTEDQIECLLNELKKFNHTIINLNPNCENKEIIMFSHIHCISLVIKLNASSKKDLIKLFEVCRVYLDWQKRKYLAEFDEK
uniref:Uncharacterized protein n=1 Tax=uncultured Caudovirales phage TaxID=2100421 RepID=A0A6J5KZN2_9CAUD|nr:hypothetical protein UFOVP88_51 [uncultured Caudovirales phage]